MVRVKESGLIYWLRKVLGLERVMVGFYFKISAEELSAHFQNRMFDIEAQEHKLKESKILLPEPVMTSIRYKYDCYDFAFRHLDMSCYYLLDETEVGTWELIRSYDNFDKLDFGQDATPNKKPSIIKPSFLH